MERLQGLLEESVRLHMVSDVPLGAFLCGRHRLQQRGGHHGPAHPRAGATFSIGFADADYNELGHARRVAARLPAPTTTSWSWSRPSLDVLDDLVWHLDEPFGDSSAIPTYMVSKLAAEHVTVALSGDGGDELFAGYDRYRVEQRERVSRFMPEPARRLLGRAGGGPARAAARDANFLRHMALPGIERYLDAGDPLPAEELADLVRPEIGEVPAGSTPGRRRARHLRGQRSATGSPRSSRWTSRPTCPSTSSPRWTA